MNYRELFGSPLQPLEFELDDGPAIEALLSAYPEGVTVSDLDHPGEELDDKLGIAQALYKEGFLIITDEASNPADAPIGRSKANTKSAPVNAGDSNNSASTKKNKTKGGTKSSQSKHTLDDDNDPF